MEYMDQQWEMGDLTLGFPGVPVIKEFENEDEYEICRFKNGKWET